MECPTCKGCGFDHDGNTCRPCRRLGRVWLPGGPLFGCKMTLDDRNVGEIVTLGTGHRGRIIAMPAGNVPTAYIAIIGDFDGLEQHPAVGFPVCVGVLSVSVDTYRPPDRVDRSGRREDQLDPLQRRTT